MTCGFLPSEGCCHICSLVYAPEQMREVATDAGEEDNGAAVDTQRIYRFSGESGETNAAASMRRHRGFGEQY